MKGETLVRHGVVVTMAALCSRGAAGSATPQGGDSGRHDPTPHPGSSLRAASCPLSPHLTQIRASAVQPAGPPASPASARGSWHRRRDFGPPASPEWP